MNMAAVRCGLLLILVPLQTRGMLQIYYIMLVNSCTLYDNKFFYDINNEVQYYYNYCGELSPHLYNYPLFHKRFTPHFCSSSPHVERYVHV